MRGGPRDRKVTNILDYTFGHLHLWTVLSVVVACIFVVIMFRFMVLYLKPEECLTGLNLPAVIFYSGPTSHYSVIEHPVLPLFIRIAANVHYTRYC